MCVWVCTGGRGVVPHCTLSYVEDHWTGVEPMQTALEVCSLRLEATARLSAADSLPVIGRSKGRQKW